MSALPGWLREVEGGVKVEILVQPRASRTRAVGEHDGRLKIQVAAPPVDGAANAELLSFLAERLKLPRRDLAIVAGETGRRKTILLRGVDPATVAGALAS
ncbi:MAG: DUF167 domain-containing protein [Pseudomonadota bacterium]|nr:MAG: YggU family protein [Pseudomonadota bacterium]